MPPLLNLSTEILLIIFSHLPPRALTSLIHSCRRLNGVVVALLYDSVYFWGSGDLSGFKKPRVPNRQRDPPPKWTRIWNLEAFTRSYCDSVSLRAHVKNIDIRWHNADKNDDNDVYQCLAALKSSCLQSLHLSPPTFSFDIPAGTAVTSLAIQHDGLRGDFYAKDDGIEFSRLHSLFCIPSLTHFCLDGWRYWGSPTYERPADVSEDRIRSSNVEYLTLNKTGVVGKDLQELLSWPKALRSFSYKACPRNYLRYEGLGNLSSRELQYALQHQRRTLENLEVDGADGVPGSDVTKPLDLTDYPALRRICIRFNFLVEPSFDRERQRCTSNPGVAPTHHLHHRLPPALEEIRLVATEMTRNYWTEGDEYESGIQDFLNWLLDVAASKPATLPALQSVGYTPSWFHETDDGKYDALEEVKEIYKEAGIDLYGYE